MFKKFRILSSKLVSGAAFLLILCSMRPSLAQDSAASQRPSIVSNAVAVDEIISELYGHHKSLGKVLALSKLADNRRYSRVPTDVLKSIKPRFTGSLEQLLKLDPDMVFLSSFNQPEVVEQIKRMGIKSYTYENAKSLDDIMDAILIVGSLTGTSMAAKKLVNEMEKTRAEFRNATPSPTPGPTSNPTLLTAKLNILCLTTDLGVAGDPSPINDIIELAGGNSLSRQNRLKGWFKIGEEALFRLNPDVLIIPSSQKQMDLSEHSVFKQLEAVKRKRVLYIDDALLFSQSHHILQAAVSIRKGLLSLPTFFSSSAPKASKASKASKAKKRTSAL